MSVDISNATATAGVDPSRVRIAGAIKQAANTTGISFEYLLATAKMESNFNPKAAASTSSARGLYQFIDQTWLGTVKEAGAQLGYGKYADAITKNPSGNYSVGDPAARSAIMKLRDDPDAASSMAAVLTQSNSFRLYDRSGNARSVSEVYSVLTSRYAGAANSQATRTAMAAVGDTPTRVTFASAAPATQPIDNAAYLSAFPEDRSVAPVTMAFASSATNALPPTDPIFRSLFQAGERSQPVSSTVRELWDNPSSRTPTVRAPQPFDLFSDRAGTFSS